MITNDVRCTREIKARIAMAKAAFNKKKTHQQIRLRAKEETDEVIHLEHSFVWWGNFDSLETRSEVPGKF
jgi:acyl-CoA thioesterase